MAIRLLTIVAVIAGVGAAVPAAAQFSTIFGEFPPRPPSEVPSARPLPPPDPSVVPQGRLPPGPPPGRSNIQIQPLPPPPDTARAPPPHMAPPPLETGRHAPPAPGGEGRPPDERRQQAALPRQHQHEVIVEPPEAKIAKPVAVFSGLDKITGRITEFEVAIDETVRFGALEVTPRVCYARPPTETQLTDGFIEVDELTLQGELKRIFTGWMFVASPGLNAVEHPIYDVWLKDCKGEEAPPATVAEAEGQGAKSPEITGQPPQPRPRPANLR